MPFIEKEIPRGPELTLPPVAWHDYLAAGTEVPFRPNDPGNPANAWWLSEASLLAYEHPNFIRNVLLKSGLPEFRFFDAPPLQAFVAWNGTWAMAVFRGTELRSPRTLRDLVADTVVQRRAFAGGYVHRGFLETLLPAWVGKPVAQVEGDREKPPLFPGRGGIPVRECSLPAGTPWMAEEAMGDFIASIRKANPGLRVYYAGHSLGAALATLAVSMDAEAAALYTFGSPMVGDAGFARSVRCPHFRWVNDRDLVPQLPPPQIMERAFGYSFQHCGKLLQLDGEGRLSAERRDAESLRDILDRELKALRRSGRKGIFGLGKAKGPSLLELPSLSDHAPLRYALKVWNLLARGERFA